MKNILHLGIDALLLFTKKSMLICRLFLVSNLLSGMLISLNVNSSALEIYPMVSDSALQACIEDTIDRYQWNNLQQITQLKCHNKNISTIDGIENFTHLKKLSLYNNKLQRVSLNSLKHLEELNLARNKINSMKLTNLPNLKKVYLFSNTMESLHLKNLPELKLLKANNNQLVVFHYSNLPKLEKIYIFNNELEHVDIHRLPKMNYMDCRQNPMPDQLYDEMDLLEFATILHDGNADDW